MLLDMLKEKGQVVLGLILVMMVALGIGLSIVQKSLVDVATSTKVEQSSRAFSAAEAGIEKGLKGDSSGVNFSQTQASAEVLDTGLIPLLPASNTRQDPLEYPPLAKEEIAHVWLTDFTSTDNPPTCSATAACYTQPTLDIYWGSSSQDKAALELTLVYYNGSQYLSRKWYLDHSQTRNPANNFEQLPCAGYTLGASSYQCRKTIGAAPEPPLPAGLMLLRARLLYSTSSQPLAVQAVGVCGAGCSIPPQARVLVSTGTSGETQRRIKLFEINKVVPPYLDYAIFSAGEIKK